MTQARLGEAVGLSFQQIQKYERGATRIGAGRLVELGRALGVPVTYFFDEGEPENGVPKKPKNAAADVFGEPEAAALIDAFYRVTDPTTRAALRRLLRAVATTATAADTSRAALRALLAATDLVDGMTVHVDDDLYQAVKNRARAVLSEKSAVQRREAPLARSDRPSRPQTRHRLIPKQQSVVD